MNLKEVKIVLLLHIYSKYHQQYENDELHDYPLQLLYLLTHIILPFFQKIQKHFIYLLILQYDNKSYHLNLLLHQLLLYLNL